jgi:hypothetical protein
MGKSNQRMMGGEVAAHAFRAAGEPSMMRRIAWIHIGDVEEYESGIGHLYGCSHRNGNVPIDSLNSLTMACAAGRRGLEPGFAPVDCPKNATLTLVRQHGQHHAGLGA